MSGNEVLATIYSWLQVLYSDTYYPFVFGFVCTMSNYLTVGREMQRRALAVVIPFWFIAGVLLAKYLAPVLRNVFDMLFPG